MHTLSHLATYILLLSVACNIYLSLVISALPSFIIVVVFNMYRVVSDTSNQTARHATGLDRLRRRLWHGGNRSMGGRS